MLDTLKYYRQQGFSFFPLPYGAKKDDNFKWGQYQKRRPTEAEVKAWFGNNAKRNIAVVCGQVSGGLVVPDCDSEDKFWELSAVIKEKTGLDILTFTLVSKTGKGYHIWLLVDDPVSSAKFPKLDIKAEGGYIVAPPSLHPEGHLYEFINPGTPIKRIRNLADIGIDLAQKRNETPEHSDNWVTEALKGIGEGGRNDTCYRLAAYFKNKHPQDITERLLLDWNKRNSPPMNESELFQTIESAYKRPPDPHTADKNNYIFNKGGSEQEIVSKRDNFGTTSGQDGDKNWGTYSEKFDQLMREAGGAQDKRDIAETIGLKATGDTFRKLLSRRKSEGKVRSYRGSPYLIQWVNREYTPTQLSRAEKTPMLDIKFPLNLHNYAAIPPGSVAVVAGTTSGGKSSFLLEVAELNLFNQPLPIYYWYNEMSEAKMRYRVEDFPLLVEGQAEGKFFPVKQGDFEFYDVLQPDAINLVDYLDRGDALYLIGEDIRQLYQALSTGVVVVAIQKKPGQEVGYGGAMSMKLANLYVVLNVVEHKEKATEGRVKIIKAKDWHNDNFNPVGLSCAYRTGGKHGKLFQDGEWERH